MGGNAYAVSKKDAALLPLLYARRLRRRFANRMQQKRLASGRHLL